MTITTTYLITVFIIVLVVSYTIYIKNIVNPLFLFVIPTGVAYILYVLYFQTTWTLSNEANLIFLIGEFSYIIGYFLSCFFNSLVKSVATKTVLISYQAVHFEKNIIVWVFLVSGIIMNFLSIIKLRQLGAGSDSFRDQFINIVSSLPPYVIYGKYITVFALCSLLYSYLTSKISRWYLLIILLGTGIVYYSATLTQARTDILIILMPLAIIFLMVKIQNANWQLFVKSVFIVILCLVLLYFSFLFVQIARFGNITDNFFSSENQTFQYISLPLTAFDRWMVTPNLSGIRHGFGIIEPIDKFLKLFQINQYEYSFAVRGQFNVYSYLSAPFLALGKFGVFFVMVIAGYFNYWLFNKAKYSAYYLLYYAFFENSVMLSFYSWQMTSMVNVYALMFILLVQFNRVKVHESKLNNKL